MKTIIQIITLVWPLIREGVMGKYEVGTYLSRRKFTTFLLTAILFLMSVFIYMAEQANYHRNNTHLLTTQLTKLKTEQSVLRKAHERAIERNKRYEAELIRIVIEHKIETPYVKNIVGIDPN